MPLEQDDLKQIGNLIADQLTKFRADFLKEEVAPMVSGATKRALSEAPQITAQQFEEQLNKLTENIQANQIDPAKLVQDSVNAVLQQLADMPDEDEPASKKKKGGEPPQPVFDEEAFQQRLMAQFEETKLSPLKKQFEATQKQLEAERQAREAAEKANIISTRNQRYVDALIKSGQIDAGAAELALDTAIKRGYLKPSEDESDFVIEQTDKYGLETQIVSAVDHLGKLIEEKPEFQYFRPARAGTGFSSQPGVTRTAAPGQPDFKVLPSANPDAISDEFILQAMKDGKGDELLRDLSLLDKVS